MSECADGLWSGVRVGESKIRIWRVKRKVDISRICNVTAYRKTLINAARRELSPRGKDEDMPKGPRGESCPADPAGLALIVGEIPVSGEIECLSPESGRMRSGIAGGVARSESTTKEQRVQIAQKAADSRWR